MWVLVGTGDSSPYDKKKSLVPTLSPLLPPCKPEVGGPRACPAGLLPSLLALNPTPVLSREEPPLPRSILTFSGEQKRGDWLRACSPRPPAFLLWDP